MTAIKNSVYYSGIATQLAIGVGLPCTSAQALIRSAFFVPKFYGGLCRGSSERRSRTGKSNFIRPATLLIGLIGGSFLLAYEDTTMPINSLGQFRPSVTPAIPDNIEKSALKLPFASEIDDDGVPRLSLWSVKPVDDYHKQIIAGNSYALEAIGYMHKNKSTFILSWIIEDMSKGGSHSGIETGFLSTIAEFAVFGALVNAKRSQL